MSKKSYVKIIQPIAGGPLYGQVSDPTDFVKGEQYSHEHIEKITKDLLIAGATAPLVTGFARTLTSGLNFSIAAGHAIDLNGLSYETADAATPLSVAAAHPTLPRIDLVYATLEADAQAELEFRPFRRLLTQPELEANQDPYPPTQFNTPTELHTRASVAIRTGVAASSPAAPAANANEVPLFRIAVAAAATTLNSGNFTDVRNLARSIASAFALIDTINSQIGNLSETIEDVVGGFLQNSTTIIATYDDAGNIESLALAPAYKTLLDGAASATGANTIVKRDADGRFVADYMDMAPLAAPNGGTRQGLTLRTPTYPEAVLFTLGGGAASGVKFAVEGDASQNTSRLNLYQGRGTTDIKRFYIDSFGVITHFGTTFIMPASDGGPGDLAVSGSMSAGVKAFLIDHPLHPLTKNLRHAATESPYLGVEYWGEVTLVGGQATVSLDAACGMEAGTFAALVTRPRVFLQNKSSFSPLTYTISGGTMTIQAGGDIVDFDTSTVEWLIKGERKDAYALALPTVDEDGKLIVEEDKPEGDADLLNPTSITLKAEEAEADSDRADVVPELIGTVGYPMHALQASTLGPVPQRTVTVHTTDMAGNPFEE
jgi:hypothetical protein